MLFHDVLNPYDILQISSGGTSIEFELRNVSDEREVVVLRIPLSSYIEQPRFEEVRVDLATGALLDAKRDLYPIPRGYAAPAPEGFPLVRV